MKKASKQDEQTKGKKERKGRSAFSHPQLIVDMDNNYRLRDCLVVAESNGTPCPCKNIECPNDKRGVIFTCDIERPMGSTNNNKFDISITVT
eukprot:m.14553 g.14553  ORF g.14553 m.14553 type:complete len:92 (-) comp7732_c0_seq5:1831-2106(-)